jgi:Peptidase family M23
VRLLPLTTLILVMPARAQDYSFPSSPDDISYFWPSSYVDHDGYDWNCGTNTYSGHGGSDYAVDSWTGMDAGRDIVAAADGTVSATNDGEDDECTTADCPGGSGYGNYVKLLHADGKSTIYAHMKTWTVAVGTGAAVACGQKLGEVGSSGYSTGPHLHFEVREASGSSSDPFDGPCSAPPSYWVNQGAYDDRPIQTCTGGEACAPVAELSCGASQSSRNDSTGATSSHLAWGCSTYTYTGPELTWWFATDRDETVTVRLSGLGADLDLGVLSSSACNGGGCLSWSENGDFDDESVSFAATAGTTYVVVVDGYDGAVSDFNLAIDCAGAWPGSNGDGGATDSGGGPTDSGGTTTGDSGDGGGAGNSDPPLVGPPGTLVPMPEEGCGGQAAGVLGLLLLRGWRRRRRAAALQAANG